MQVSNLLNRFATPVGLGAKNDPANDGPDPTNSVSSASSTSGVSSSFRDILAHYDVRNISPREFSELIQELHKAGEISDADLKELSQIRVELDASQASADDPVDLVDFLASKLKELEDQIQKDREDDPTANIDRSAAIGAERQLSWIQKFATVQADASTDALNTLA